MPENLKFMSTNKKNQHYIPKFYLRNFSYMGNNNQIGVYNLNSAFFCQTGKLKSQGSKNFYYGEDGRIEDALCDIESKLSKSIRKIITEKSLPKELSEEHIILLVFVALTHLRNPILINYIKESADNMRNRLLELNPNCDINSIRPEITHDYAIELALSSIEFVVQNIRDLNYKLLLNKTKTPFIASDFPIVKYNRFLEIKKWPYAKAGYGTIGLQIFIPLSPEICIVFYDPHIYKVGFKKQSILNITNTEDVDSINELQIINCFENVFFNESTSENYIKRIVAKCSRYRRANQTEIELGHLREKNEPININAMKNLVIMGVSECETKLDITGIKFHSGAEKTKLNNCIAQLRPIPKILAEKRTE